MEGATDKDAETDQIALSGTSIKLCSDTGPLREMLKR